MAHAVHERPAIRNEPGHSAADCVGDAVHGRNRRRVEQAIRHLLLRDDANRVAAPNPDACNATVLHSLECIFNLVKAALRRKN